MQFGIEADKPFTNSGKTLVFGKKELQKIRVKIDVEHIRLEQPRIRRTALICLIWKR
jgi:hypothetical protein